LPSAAETAGEDFEAASRMRRVMVGVMNGGEWEEASMWSRVMVGTMRGRRQGRGNGCESGAAAWWGAG